MLLSDYQPRSMMSAKETLIERPKFPVFDTHNHLELFGDRWIKDPPALLGAMDEAGVQAVVDLDGAWGEELVYRAVDLFKNLAPERFRIFGGVDWSQWFEQGNHFGEWAASRLREQVRRGAEGAKIWKNFGLRVKDDRGNLVRINDERLEPVWNTAGELHFPINFHIADPVAFFDPLDQYNERYEELVNHPDWHFPSPPFPPFLSLVEDMKDVIRRHPQVTFIGSHVGCYAENLNWVGRTMDECPNFYIDISARLAELGRQPYTARRFFINHADRIMFGLDGWIEASSYQTYYRFLETDDEYFPYTRNPTPPTGRWNIYGIYLPDDVLEKVYWSTANSVFSD